MLEGSIVFKHEICKSEFKLAEWHNVYFICRQDHEWLGDGNIEKLFLKLFVSWFKQTHPNNCLAERYTSN